MAISSNATGLRSGVCTSTTRPTAPYEGQMIYETDTNRVLVWDNSAWVMIADSDQPPGLQLVIPSGATNGTLSGSTVTVNSAVSSCTVSGCFSSEFENYRIVISGVDCSGSGSGGYFTFSGSTGSTYQSAAYYMAYTSATLNGTNRNASGDGGLWTVSGTERNDAVIDVFGPNVNAKTTWSVQFTNDLYPGVSQGYDSNTVQHTGFVLKSPAATTLTGGTIRVYGYRN